MLFMLSAPAFLHQASIPVVYTCQGEDRSPELKWSGAPPGTKSLALIVDDPDAPDPKAPKMTYVHWVLLNLPPDSTGLPAGVQRAQLPTGAQDGLNDWGREGYGGPCPPIGRHRYFFKLYALDSVLKGLPAHPRKNELERAMEGHIVARAELIGTYEKAQ